MRNTSRPLRFTNPAAGVMLVAATLAASAQAQAQGAESATFGDTVDVQRINVEVWVTDKNGDPVIGLEAKDFEVREDGKKVAISNFTEIRRRGPSTPSPPASPEPIGEPNAPRLEIAPLETDETGFLILYIDDLFSGPSGRGQLIEDLRTFFARQPVSPDRVLILRQDEALKVEANLGATTAELEAALSRLEQPSNRGIQTRADETRGFDRLMTLWESEAVMRRIEGRADPCDFFVEKAVREVQSTIELSRNRVEETLGHLADAAGFLGSLPGPKTLVYVSDGLPTTPGSSLMGFIKSLCPAWPAERRLDLYHGLNESFRLLARHANANRVTIYTLQPTGLRDQGSRGAASQRGLRRTTESLDRYASETRIQNRQGLFLLADETGGRAVVNRNHLLDEFEQVAEDMTGYYSLAYEPPHRGDGLEHRIKVRLRGGRGSTRDHKDLRVRYRPGYRDKSPDQRMFERLKSTLYLDLMSNPLEVSLGAGQAARGGGTSTVPLHVQIPVERITFLNYLGAERASFRVLALARDEHSGKTAFKQQLFRLTRPPSVPNQQISLVFEIELEEGVHVVALGVRDEATMEASFVATSLEIPGTPDAVASGG